MSWTAIMSLMLLTGNIATLYIGPKSDWSTRKLVWEFTLAILGIIVGVYGLRNY